MPWDKCKGHNRFGEKCGAYANGTGYCARHSGRFATHGCGRYPRLDAVDAMRVNRSKRNHKERKARGA